MTLKEVYNHNLKRKFEVEIPASVIDAGFREAIENKIKKNVYPGFRKGKTPFDFVARQEEGLIDSVIVDQVYKQWYEVKRSNNLVIFNDQEDITSVDATGYKNEKAGVKFTVECELLPEIPKVDFTGMKVKTRTFEVSSEDIEKYKEREKSQLVDWLDMEPSSLIEKGDRVLVDLFGKVDGKEFKGGQLENFECQVGDGKVITSLSDGLIGMKVGEKRMIQVLFPEDYHDVGVAGKEAVFDTLIKAAKRSQKSADPDAALLKALACEAPEELDEKVKKIITSECTAKLNDLLRQEIEAQLGKYDFQVPESLVERQKRYIQTDTPVISPDELEKEALRRTKLSLILADFAMEKKISIDKKDVAQHLFNISAAAGLDLNYLMDIYRNNKDFAGSVTLKLMESKIIATLLGTVQKEATGSTVDEIFAVDKETAEA